MVEARSEHCREGAGNGRPGRRTNPADWDQSLDAHKGYDVPFLCQVDDLPDKWFGFVFEQLLCQQHGVVSAAGGSPRGDQFYIYYLRLTTRMRFTEPCRRKTRFEWLAVPFEPINSD